RGAGEIARTDAVVLSGAVTGTVIRPYSAGLDIACDAEVYRAIERIDAARGRSLTPRWDHVALRGVAVATLAFACFGAVLQIVRTRSLGSAAWMTALAVAVGASSSAFALAAPAARVIAVLRARAAGIVVKNADALASLAAIDVACFDKSGTLLAGE